MRLRPPNPKPAQPTSQRSASLASSVGWGLLFIASKLTAPWKPVPSTPVTGAPAISTSTPISILTLDGGGIRGRNQIALVAELEELTGAPLAVQFDLVAGTSIGGCGALFISRYPLPGEAARQARRAMTELQYRCFAESSKRRLLSEGHYCADARRRFTEDVCGNVPCCGGAGPHAFALAARRGRRGQLEPFLFRTYPHRQGSLAGTHTAQLFQAIEATSAAPFMFPSSQLDGDNLADGGMIANDPTLIALKEARELWPSRPIGLLLSIGTGEEKNVDCFDFSEGGGEHTQLGRAYECDKSDGVQSLWQRAGEGAADRDVVGREARRLLEIADAVRERSPKCDAPHGYFRFQPPVGGVSPIEHNESKLRIMEAGAEDYFRQSHALRALCQILEHNRQQRAVSSPGSSSLNGPDRSGDG